MGFDHCIITLPDTVSSMTHSEDAHCPSSRFKLELGLDANALTFAARTVAVRVLVTLV
jgi:hypothetical protein